jgi:selenide,water dikinase
VDVSQIKLTSLVRNAGCASKIAPADLEAVLKRLPPVNDPAVISGLAAADDAAIYRIADNLCLVQTVDVFTPCVDDPHLFGRICAANCLSDIYAMGGDPRTALSILAFPSETMHGEVMYRMLAGAMETLAQAGVALVGGHSIKDDEIKLGFAITGVIDPVVAEALDRPRVGDVLVLTKPLGTGVLAFAQQVGRGHAAGFAAAAESMATLNKAAADAMREAGASACTDITGFGLFGHLIRMMRQRQLTARVYADALPAFDGVLDALGNDVIPGALERNREFLGEDLQVEPGVDAARVNLGFDAQTSGGLLIAIAPERLEQLQRSLAARSVRGFDIGRIVGESSGRIVLGGSYTDFQVCCVAGFQTRGSPDIAHPADLEVGDTAGLETTQARHVADNPAATSIGNETMKPISSSGAHEPGCCANAFGNENPPSSVAESQKAFGALMRSVQAAGALDAKAKELILFSLVLQSRCHPCFDTHYEKARAMGITQAELDEAAWCAIAMGGAPVKMFYQECLRLVQNYGLGEAKP